MSSISNDLETATVQWLSSYSEKKLDVISTGSLGLDLALSTNGFVRGRMVEVYGKPSAGKSSLALSTAVSATKRGEIVAYFDLEHALAPRLPVQLGADPAKFIVLQPYSGEDALESMRKLIETSKISMCVLDSITSLVPTAELSGDFSTASVGTQAKLVSRLCRDFISLLGKTNTLLIVINQVRSNITPYGGGDITTGGKAIPFYSSHRVKVRFAPGKKDAYLVRDSRGNVVGHKVVFDVMKNKFGAAYGSACATLYYGKGFSVEDELIDIGCEIGLIEKGGSWYTLFDTKVQGKEKLAKEIIDNKGLNEKFIKEISAALDVDVKGYLL